ncbi:MAG: DUF4251 domain-containing protein [Muribaculaceae bacterium]
MKKAILTIILISCICYMVNAQQISDKKTKEQTTETKKQKKEREKRLNALIDSINFNNAKIGLNEQNFVLEAERVTFKNGVSVHTQSNTNFISVSNGKAMVQLAFAQGGRMGYNGLGGITVEGNASNIKYKTDKRGNITMTMSVIGIAISANVRITLIKDSNQAMATVEPNFNSYSLTVYGLLVPNQLSSIYKAMPL